ncbi:MAG: hypothetical protein ACRDGF_02585 [Chloroflexota bacterium]
MLARVMRLGAGVAAIGQIFLPGEKVPASGVYKCTAGCEHEFVAAAAGESLPTLPAGCRGATWTLAGRHPTEEAVSLGQENLPILMQNDSVTPAESRGSPAQEQRQIPPG